MAKVPYQFVTKEGKKLFQIKINKNHVTALSQDPKFQVSTKKKEIKSHLFGEMFKDSSAKQTLSWNHYKCGLCAKDESFLFDSGKVYCNSCYDSFVNKLDTNIVDSLLSTQPSPTAHVTVDTEVYQNKKQSSFNRKRKDNREDILENINDETTDMKWDTISKFEEKLSKHNDFKQIPKKYNYLTQLTNQVQTTKKELLELNEGMDIIYAYYLEEVMHNRFNNNLSIPVRKVSKFKMNDRLDMLTHLDKYSVNGIEPHHISYEFSKLFIGLSLSSMAFTNEQLQYLIFINQDKCFISGESLNEDNTEYIYLSPFHNDDIYEMIKVSKNTADKYSYNNNLLEGVVQLLISDDSVTLPTIVEAYLLVEYNKIAHSLSKVKTMSQFTRLNKVFHSFYNVYIKQLFNDLFPDFEKSISNENTMFKIPMIEYVLNEIKVKTQG